MRSSERDPNGPCCFAHEFFQKSKLIRTGEVFISGTIRTENEAKKPDEKILENQLVEADSHTPRMPIFPRETLEKNLNSIYTEDTMAETVNVKNVGLRGVTVADTKVSFIDGEKGVLIYRGYRIEELAQSASFMEVAYLLLNGSLPLKKELTAFMTQVTAAREVPRHIYECFKKWPKDSNPMDVLQATVPMLATVDPDLQDETRAANFRMATRLIGRLP
ncbi:MAG: citrate/2-methylcitrate synthase, partial [Desulfatiglandaceae bacterium]